MNWLVIYRRSEGKLLRCAPVEDGQEAIAERFRIKREHATDPDLEIVVLGADSVAALRATHGRYFHGYEAALAKAQADYPRTPWDDDALPPPVTAVASVLGLDPYALDWHVEAEHGWEPHDEGYEDAVWAAAACDDPAHLEDSRRSGTRTATPAYPADPVTAARDMSCQPKRTPRSERRR